MGYMGGFNSRVISIAYYHTEDQGSSVYSNKVQNYGKFIFAVAEAHRMIVEVYGQFAPTGK